MSSYPQGTLVRLSATFKNLSGTLIDPTSLRLYIKDPQGTAQTLTGGSIAHDGTGLFHYDVLLSKAGRWIYRWFAQGQTSSVDIPIEVDGSAFFR